MLGVVGWKVWPVSNFAQQHATTSNNMQQGVQTDATCNIQQCCVRLHGSLQKKKVWNENSHLTICNSVKFWMPIVGVFTSNSFSLVPLPWKIPLEEQHPAGKCSKSLELFTSVRRYTVLSSHFRPCDVLPESCFQLLSYPRAYVCKTYNKRQIPLSCVQTDATLLDVTCWVRLHTLLHFVGCCCVLLRKVWNLSNF